MFSDGEHGRVCHYINGSVALYEHDRQPPSEMLLLKNYESEYSVLPGN